MLSRANAFAAAGSPRRTNRTRSQQAALVALAIAAGTSMAFGQGRYLLLGADSTGNPESVQAALLATGVVSDVTVHPTTSMTPTLSELLAYDAVLTWTNLSYVDENAMGDVLADYVDAGGGVVVAVYAVSTTTTNRSLRGRWETEGYDIIPQRSTNHTATTSLGTIHEPQHPIWAGVTGFSGATNYARATTLDLAPGAVRVADWADGRVLAVTSIVRPNRVDLNFFPGAWHVSPDAARVMANSLQYAGAAAATDPGGCCLPDGSCQILAALDCVQQGGNFRGPNTDCTDPCPQPGACCFPSGDCDFILESACSTGGGTWSGAGVTCAAANCPQPETGACCLGDGTCITEWEGGCIAQGGMYQGDNTDCANITCPTRLDTSFAGPSSASVDGAGAYFLVEATNPQGIVVHGFDINTNAAAGTALTAHVYFRPLTFVGYTGDISAWILLGEAPTTAAGAGNRTPVPVGGLHIGGGETWALRVGSSGGVRYTGSTTPPQYMDSNVTLHMGEVQNNFFGTTTFGTYPTNLRGWDGAIYYTVGATVTSGACCLPSGACEEVREVICTGQGGTYHGDNTECATTPPGGCPQPPEGACCLNDGNCIIVWEPGCLDQGGTYFGDNSTCEGRTCPTILITDPPNNGLSAAGSGIFLDLTAQDALTIPRIDYVASATAGTPTTVEIWTKQGSYVGWNLDPSPWTLHDTVHGVSAGTTENATLLLNNPLIIEAQETLGIYLLTQAGGIRYTGATGAQPNHSDSNLALFSDTVQSTPWGGTTFTPRVFSGAIHYILGGSQICYANCDGSTTEPILTVDDFTCFINEFAQAQTLPVAQQITHYANCDGSTTEPILTVDDFTCFINAFAQGCP